jgi:hypothetical protein
MKTVLAIWHLGDKGKTETIRAFANHLLSTYSTFRPVLPIPAFIPIKGDFRLVVEIDGKIVGIESQGDPTTNLKARLQDLADSFNCEIIICSSRTKGDTIRAINNLRDTRGYQIIWTSTYEIVNKGYHNFVNQLNGKQLLELLQGLSLI